MSEKQIGDYKVLEYIGSGGMAKVYLAVHKEIPNLKVVLKVLTYPQHAERFKQEADKLAFLDGNPNICKIRHFFNHGDEFVIAMEYIDGPSLEGIIKQKGQIPVHESLSIVLDILLALEPAHEQGIYHRDIKPSNVMFSKSGQVKIIDFGIAKGKSDPKLTVVGTAAGTPEYMAPEQFGASEEIDYARCDIYAVGTVLYRMVTGEMPFKGDNEFLLRDAKLMGEPQAPSKLNREVSRELDEIIIKSIQSDPEKRFASVSEMKARLEQVRAAYGPGAGTEARAADKRKSAPSQPKGAGRAFPRAGIYVAAALLLVAAAVAVLPGWMRDGERSIRRGRPETAAPGEADPAQEQERAPDAGAPPGAVESEPAETAVRTPAERTARENAAKAREESAPAPAAAPPPRTPAPRPAQGKLAVGSRPPRGEIFINNEPTRKTTPYTFDLDPGQYSIRIIVHISGAERHYLKRVTVESGETVNVFWNAEEEN